MVMMNENAENEINVKNNVKPNSNLHMKVLIRNLPLSMNEVTFLNQIAPLPLINYFRYVMDEKNGSRAYLNFVESDEIWMFKEKFDGYVFLDEKGDEYEAIVEYCPFQKIPKSLPKPDPKNGTLDKDEDFQNFVKNLKERVNKKGEHQPIPMDKWIEEIERKETDAKQNYVNKPTKLLEYLAKEKQKRKDDVKRQREERLAAQENRKSALANRTLHKDSTLTKDGKNSSNNSTTPYKLGLKEKRHREDDSFFDVDFTSKNVRPKHRDREERGNSQENKTSHKTGQPTHYNILKKESRTIEGKKEGRDGETSESQASPSMKKKTPIKVLTKKIDIDDLKYPSEKGNHLKVECLKEPKRITAHLKSPQKENKDKGHIEVIKDLEVEKDISHEPVKFNFEGNIITRIIKEPSHPAFNSSLDDVRQNSSPEKKVNFINLSPKEKKAQDPTKTEKRPATESKPSRKERPPIQLYKPGRGLKAKEKN